MTKKSNTLTFIKKAKKIHGNKYDYSKVNYINSKEKICIICPDHGEFWQNPDKHLQGRGCPLCAKNHKSNTDIFIAKAKEIHKNKYDYSKIDYKNNTTKVCIICPGHGEFWQTPHNHLKGQGCPECGKLLSGKELKYNADSFIEQVQKIHHNKYDYSLTKYKNLTTKISIICPEHGIFEQIPYLHVEGTGCPKCAHKELGLNRRTSLRDFVEKSKQIHENKYNYSKTEYITARHKVCIICPDHGEFWQAPYHHLSGNGCPKCVSPFSKSELEIYSYIKTICPGVKIEQHNREILGNKEIDIYIPSLRVGIEYNGLYWHNSTIVDRNYHYNKLNAAKEKGIKLIQIFEDEYVNNKDIVLSKIAHILGKCEKLPKIMGRKCEIKEINKTIAKGFLTKNHIQGFVSSTLHIGAFYNNVLVAVMSFKQETKDNDVWELTRCATDNNYICQGVAGKLFSYFVKNYNPDKIKSFADRRWTINEEHNLYTQLGFDFDYYTKPDYRYYSPNDGCIRQHKFGFRKDKLNRKYGLPLSMTETEMTHKLGYTKIWDCGLIKYAWHNKKEGAN